MQMVVVVIYSASGNRRSDAQELGRMKQLQQVLWTKGTFLTPQHLQLQDRYIENLLQFQLESVAYRLWGFARLKIDENKLAEGQVAMLEATGIFPDGLLFDAPMADALPPSRMIAQFFSEKRCQLSIYLSVPEQRDNGVNVGSEPETRTRYVPELRMVRDENSGLSDKPVQIARKNFKLLVEGENLEGSAVIQVARVERTAAGTFRLVSQFVPPMIDIHGSDFLRTMAGGLMETLAARSSLLASSRRQRKQSLAEFPVADIANFWLLYTVNYHLPVFRHLLHRGTVHPEQLFGAMLALAGGLTTFSTTITPRDLPEYVHEDLGQCFSNLEQKIRLLLETVIPANFVSIPLKLVQPSLYAASIDDDKYLHETRWYLAVSADVRDADLVERVPGTLKAGSASHVDEMIRQALPGLKMTFKPDPPSEIPVRLKYKYFALDLSGKVWQGIQRARNLAVYVPDDFPNPRLELIVLLPQRKD
jgi:type VI secretion system protein ImpJ